MIYTGIGARELPEDMRKEFIFIGKRFAERGWILRSGGADGADSAFECGCGLSAPKEIFLPWKGFNNNSSSLYITKENEKELFDIACKVYPGWQYAKNPVRLLHARNVQQIMGETPGESLITDFVVCWTNRPENQARGTMFAVTLANQKDIPVYNFYNLEKRKEFYKAYFK